MSTEKFNLMIFSPLDSFSVIHNQNNFFFNNININIYLYFLLIVFIFFYFFENSLNFYKNKVLFLNLKNAFYIFYSLFKNLQMSIRFERYLNFLISVFFFILFTNIAGFFLLEFSLTSHIVVTMFISFSIFFNYLIVSLLINNEKFINLFLLPNLNLFLTFILFIIESVSFFVRPFSLGVRLFANILSGHILIHIFFGAFLFSYKIFFWVSLIVLFMVAFVFIMEIFVSFVQSYIFLILSIIYSKDAFIKH